MTRKIIATEIIPCDACHFLRQQIQYGLEGLTFAEYRQIVMAKWSAWCILPGDECMEVSGNIVDFINNGRGLVIDRTLKPYIYHQKPEIHAICLKYGFYENE